MISTLRLLAVFQLDLTTLVTPATSQPEWRGPPLRRTNNNTWMISAPEFNHPGPALKRQADNVRAIRFTLRRSSWESNVNARTLTFTHVPADKGIYYSYGMLKPVITSEWRQCSGYRWQNMPPEDEGMSDELSKRLRFRLSDLKTSPSGNFKSVTMEIVNHIAIDTRGQNALTQCRFLF